MGPGDRQPLALLAPRFSAASSISRPGAKRRGSWPPTRVCGVPAGSASWCRSSTDLPRRRAPPGAGGPSPPAEATSGTGSAMILARPASWSACSASNRRAAAPTRSPPASRTSVATTGAGCLGELPSGLRRGEQADAFAGATTNAGAAPGRADRRSGAAPAAHSARPCGREPAPPCRGSVVEDLQGPISASMPRGRDLPAAGAPRPAAAGSRWTRRPRAGPAVEHEVTRRPACHDVRRARRERCPNRLAEGAASGTPAARMSARATGVGHPQATVPSPRDDARDDGRFRSTSVRGPGQNRAATARPGIARILLVAYVPTRTRPPGGRSAGRTPGDPWRRRCGRPRGRRARWPEP